MTPPIEKGLPLPWGLLVSLLDCECKEGKTRPELGPNAVSLAGALPTSEGYQEANLPKSWKMFAESHPAWANVHRQGATSLADKNKTVLKPDLSKGFSKAAKPFTISNDL